MGRDAPGCTRMSTIVSPSASTTPTTPTTRGFAAVVGLAGAFLGLVGFGLGMVGDPVLSSLTTLGPALGLVLVGVVGAGLAPWRPGVAAAMLGAALIGLALALGPLIGPWYDGLLAASTTGRSAQVAYWIEAPAMALFIASCALLAIAALLSLLARVRDAR